MMRVLVAASQGGANGIETYTRRLVESLRARGYAALLAGRSDAADVPLPPPSWPLRRAIGPFESQRTHRSLRHAVTLHGAGVLHATYPEFAVSSERTVVTAWHPATSIAGRLRMMRSRGERGARAQAMFTLNDLTAYRRSAAVVAVTPETQRALEEAGVDSEFVPPFIEDADVQPTAAERSNSCVLVARWLDDPRKGLPTALTAVARVRERGCPVRLTLVGGFRNPASTASLPEFCDVVGVLEPRQVRATVARSGCCLMPSVWEEFGYAGIEALAAGTPLVVSDLPAFEGVVARGLFVVDGGGAEAWSQTIVEALELDDVEFPPAFRSSVGLVRLVEIYDRVAEGR